MDTKIISEKLDQAVALLQEQQLDVWLTFVRETSLVPDPCLDLIAGLDATWHSALIVSRTGERIAIVGRFDADNFRALGGYGEVIPYDESLRLALRETLTRLNPAAIAVNFSENDPAADGLTHGMWLELQKLLSDTSFATRLVSAEKLISALRGRKSPAEVARIKTAIRTTEKLYRDLGETLRPGQTEKEIAVRLQSACRALGYELAWDEPYCPVVNAGPQSAIGHAAPGKFKTARGQLLHLDFGVRQNGFCSDLQRMWYFLDRGEKRAPEDVRRAWEACWGAIHAGAEKLKPGVQGWEVDAAARAFLVQAGYPEYRHGLGHHLGRAAHDGSTLLGPRWERYGQTPYGVVEAGNVFTLELGTLVPGRGYIGLEEDVLVTATGIEYLSKPQTKIWLV
jgi:Xaa-Pro aminopeptidase